MTAVKPITFSILQLLQRADDALRLERARARPDRLKLIWLKRRRHQLAARLRRSFGASMLAGA
jgi:hypothetical protein